MVFHWSDNKSPHVSRTLFSIRANLIHAVVSMVSTRVFISNSSSLFPILWWPYRAHRLRLVSPSLSCCIFFQSSSKVQMLISLFAFFQFYSVEQQFLFYFLLTITRSDRLAEIRWSVCISKSSRTLCISFSRTDSGLYIYYLNFLHNSQWITLPTQLCLILFLC